MAKNEYLPFGLADGANVLSNAEYGKLAARTNGFSSGVAKSQELNKVWRQASVIASVVAQFIAETTGKDVLDDGNLTALQDGLLKALRETVSSNVPAATLNVAGITKLSNETNSYVEDMAATPKSVKYVNDNANGRLEKSKNGADIPNKNEFVKNLGLLNPATALLSSPGYIILPTMANNGQNVLIIQWMTVSVAKSNGLTMATALTQWPIPFPTVCMSAVSALSNTTTYLLYRNSVISTEIIDRATILVGSGYSASESYVTVWGVGY
ncbi:putative protein StfE [Xenorhabdus mauleonii]|uniref:Phage tail fibre repeat-containing protein n=1 Tax=Xenorhabdus mauleonii TaxID=351675 RepID=A0A1I3WPZ1_9GAMM|nr:phage tail protein [Xenorhabdus mauleonii]PHM39254.1 putative protein StfE [Xenorhabdus mauleonii]SFK09585.1 Phage tail fibre repeat-containing protein [Xenorhabdus mauleonii]